MPDGSHYMTLVGDKSRPASGLLLWRPGELDAVFLEPARNNKVHARQGTVDVPGELAVTRPQGWQLTLAVLDMISAADNEDRPVSKWALDISAQPLLDMIEAYGRDALGKDWDATLPAEDGVVSRELAKRGVM
jgi:hypothetical protein